MKDIISMSREKTARLIPNAIQVVQVNTEKVKSWLEATNIQWAAH